MSQRDREREREHKRRNFKDQEKFDVLSVQLCRSVNVSR